MDPKSQERFDTLHKTDPANWTEADRGFMFARRSYLHPDEVKALGLDQAVPSPSEEPSPEPVPNPAALSGKKKPAA